MLLHTHSQTYIYTYARTHTQIKLTVSGGVASKYDPIDSTQYTLEEMRAAVQAAEDWGTYIMVHAYHPKVRVS